MRRPLTPKHWRILPGDIQAEAALQIELGVHPVIARLLVQRGMTTPELADEFLNPTLDRMHDPFLLPDAEAACQRLKTALAANEHILIHGDYDGDGVTSAALWTRFLRSLGANADVFVPHRGRDGYDMRKAFVERAKAEGVTLIVTTDCGIQRVDEVALAREHGIDVIITDHHTPNTNGKLPEAVAVVNPQRSDSRYPFRHLAGVGVAFKLCEALARTLGHHPDKFRRGFLDLACIGTVTDCMPLIGENRIIVKYGLEALRASRKPGLQALIAEAGYAEKPLDSRAIGFGLGPRLNAASRIDETQLALDLLLTKDDTEAFRLARRLTELNTQRRDDQARVFDEAMAQVAQQDMTEARCLVVSGCGWAHGIVGLVASKIVERFNRPCIVIGLDPATGAGRGSARSIQPFNIFSAIDSCRDLLQEYGGHAHAAGLAIEESNVPDFAAQMNRIALSLLSEDDCVPAIDAAQELDVSEISDDLVEQIEAMAPFGHANHEPVFVSRGVRLHEIQCLGKEKQHLKLFLNAEGVNRNNLVPALWWNRSEVAEPLAEVSQIDICYRPEFNIWRDNRTIQFMLQDLRPPEW